MSSYQRRRGPWITFWRVQEIADARGNQVKVLDHDSKVTVRCAVIPERGVNAELAGQMYSEIVQVIIPGHVEGVEIWSRAEMEDGTQWDLTLPPKFHRGSRMTRHWTIELRRRP